MPTVEVAHMLKEAKLRQTRSRAAAIAAAEAISNSSKSASAKKEASAKKVPAKKTKPATKLSVVKKGKETASPSKQEKVAEETKNPLEESPIDTDGEPVA
jgi:hypothetical protein